MIVRREIARARVMNDRAIQVPHLVGSVAKHKKRQMRVRLQLRGLLEEGHSRRRTMFPPLPKALLDQIGRACGGGSA
jgi:hypothetical protein